jgi:hypothetical protein
MNVVQGLRGSDHDIPGLIACIAVFGRVATTVLKQALSDRRNIAGRLADFDKRGLGVFVLGSSGIASLSG